MNEQIAGEDHYLYYSRMRVMVRVTLSAVRRNIAVRRI